MGLRQTENVKNMIVYLDDSAAPYTYVGRAPIGSDTSQAVWQIKRIDETSGVIILFADGDSNYNNVWDNRASLNYS
jgi:hypothetical protein